MPRTHIMLLIILALCLALGALLGLGFPWASESLGQAWWLEGLAGLNPYLGRALAGALLFGLPAALITRAAMGRFARDLLGEMMAQMRAKNFLPYTFKLEKKESLSNTYENLRTLFDANMAKLALAESERSKYQAALSRYADPTVAGTLKFQGRDYNIQGGRKHVAVLFADIRGFTPMTESLQPEQVVEVLNQHFTAATAAINRNGGKVNKFIGDAVMALFDEPPAYKDGASAARNAILAGLEMQAKWEMAYPQWQAKMAEPVSFGLGVGVHTGTVILGNIGSDERLEYTAIGDTVNLTARICSLAKDGEVLASEEAWAQVVGQFEAFPRPPVPIKGKTGLYTTYLMGRKLFNR